MSQIYASRLARNGLATFVGISSLAIGLSLPVTAQTAADVDPLEGLGTQDSPEGVFSGGEAGFRDAMDFFHRLNLSGGTTMEQYQIRQQEQIGNAAAEFFRLREERVNSSGANAVDAAEDEEASPVE